MTTLVTASAARADLYRLIDQTAESHQPILISGKRRSAILVSADDWQAIQETLYLLAIPGMRESIKKGMAEPVGSEFQIKPQKASETAPGNVPGAWWPDGLIVQQ